MALAAVRSMLDVLGLDPLSPTWAGSSSGTGEREAIDHLVAALVEQRQQARADKDFEAADRVRDQLTAAGIEVEDTPQGPRWSLRTKGAR